MTPRYLHDFCWDGSRIACRQRLLCHQYIYLQWCQNRMSPKTYLRTSKNFTVNWCHLNSFFHKYAGCVQFVKEAIRMIPSWHRGIVTVNDFWRHIWDDSTPFYFYSIKNIHDAIESYLSTLAVTLYELGILTLPFTMTNDLISIASMSKNILYRTWTHTVKYIYYLR